MSHWLLVIFTIVQIGRFNHLVLVLQYSGEKHSMHTCAFIVSEGYVSVRCTVQLRSFVRSFVRTFVRSYVRTFVPSYLRTFVPSYLRTFVPSYLRTFVRSYVRTFVCSFICSFIYCIHSKRNLTKHHLSAKANKAVTATQ